MDEIMDTTNTKDKVSSANQAPVDMDARVIKEEPMSETVGNAVGDDIQNVTLNGTLDTPSNAMSNLESQKAAEAAMFADELLNSMLAGDMGEGDGPASKRPRVQVADNSELSQLETFTQCVNIIPIKTEGDNCTHEVAVPPDVTYVPLQNRATEAAKEYPFPLDGFQREAIRCIDNNQSVLVSAHTSAGKTVVALYAIAQCLRDKQKVIYTSPIKALSNQKYRELDQEFGDVGLMTGDVTLNPDASCIVMTTEILRSMLYKGSEMMREVGYVIFDEIHYMRDKERGVVWEETIIMLQHNVHHVFLSATIPNACQFAQWVAWLHSVPCHVVYTDYRPTPLQHFVFPAGGNGLYEVVNVKGEFRQDKFTQAMSGLAESKEGSFRGGRKNQQQADSNVVKIIRTIKERDMLPCIIFSFSRKECEAYAMSLKDLDFTTQEEKESIECIYNNAVELLGDEDKKLPQIKSMLPLLKRGIGCHHSGLLPLVKEVIEILFGESLIKTLFATETFSMGLNMPARTVLFTSARKFDGKNNRWLTSGEYIQMSGRAGRRGLDAKGLVILMVDAKMSPEDAKHIIKGATDPLNSQFRLTYNMILNLIRVHGWNPEHMMERSFYQFQVRTKIPELLEKQKTKRDEIHKFQIDREDEMVAYSNTASQIEKFKKTISKYMQMPKYVIPFLHPGRLLRVVAGNRDFGWGVVVQYKRQQNPDDPSDLVYFVVCLLGVDPGSITPGVAHTPTSIRPPPKDVKPAWELIPMMFDCIREVSAVRIRMMDKLENEQNRDSTGKMIQRVVDQMHKAPTLLCPKNDMRIPDAELIQAVDRKAELEQRLKELPITKISAFNTIKSQYDRKQEMVAELEAIKRELEASTSIHNNTELQNRQRILRRLEYIDQAGVITKKGQIACEISASDELMLTEMLYSNVFTNLSADHMAALLSCFVFQDNAQMPKLADELSGCLRELHVFARRIAKISNECKVEIVEDDYVASFKPGLMDVIYNWARGLSFGEIIKTTDVFEGTIIRTLRRLEEVLRELAAAAQGMDNKELAEKVESARNKIKRDIVFAASLYL